MGVLFVKVSTVKRHNWNYFRRQSFCWHARLIHFPDYFPDPKKIIFVLVSWVSWVLPILFVKLDNPLKKRFLAADCQESCFLNPFAMESIITTMLAAFYIVGSCL